MVMLSKRLVILLPEPPWHIFFPFSTLYFLKQDGVKIFHQANRLFFSLND
jgi:hypothetical protein